MWRPLALLGALVLLQVATITTAEEPPVRTKRLTTFGKTPATETDPKIYSESPDDGSKNLYVPYTHGTPRGKECRADDDCAALEFTTCKMDTDRKKRCLCHDLQPPANGECATKRRDEGELFRPVDARQTDITSKAPPLFQPYAGVIIELHQPCNYDHECIAGAECVVNSTVKANEKRCYCRFGYEEEDNQCNSGLKTNAWASLMLLISLVLATLHTN